MWRLDHVLSAVGGTALKVEGTVLLRHLDRLTDDQVRASSSCRSTAPISTATLTSPTPTADRAVEASAARGAKTACASAQGHRHPRGRHPPGVDGPCPYQRREIDARFVAITGSNGKTSTKELLVHILGGPSAPCNERNYNNQIGVSKAILAIEGKPEVCILELGTNHPGEIASLARVVEPDLSLITNVNASHLGRARGYRMACSRKRPASSISPSRTVRSLSTSTIPSSALLAAIPSPTGLHLRDRGRRGFHALCRRRPRIFRALTLRLSGRPHSATRTPASRHAQSV